MGEIIGVALIFRDVTQRQQAAKVKARLAAIVESSDDAIFSIDLSGRITSWNKAAKVLFGYTTEEIVGKPIMALTPPDRANEEDRVLESVRRGEKIEHYETTRRRKDGGLVEISLTVSPILGEAGNIIGASTICRDITERKRVERELAESVREQQALFQLADQLHHAQSLDDVYGAALDAIFIALQCDRASILLFDEANVMRFVAWRGLSGAYRRAVEGHSPWAPDERNPRPVCVNDIEMAEIDARLKAVIKDEGISALAFIPLLCDGKLIGKFMTYFNAPHIFSDGELALSLTIARQLAFGVDRQRAEELLRKYTNQLALIANIALVFIAQCDTQARFKFVNKAYAERFGLRPEDCVGKRIPEVIGEEAYRRFRPYIDVVLRGESVEFEIEVPYTTIGEHFMHCSYAPEFDAEGKVIGWVAAITDITKLKRVEEALRYHLDLTRTITDNTRSCLLMMNAEGRGTFANPSAERVTGFKPEELIGEILHYKIHHMRLDGTPFPREECPLDRALPLSETVIDYEDTFVHKNGHFYPVRCNARPIFKDDISVGTVIEVQDITKERQLLEAERAAREQAEAANRLKDEFLATVSHELRTPLNAILGWTVMLRSGRLTPDKTAEALEIIERSARAQNRLVEDLLDVSRIVTGKVQLRFQPVAMAKVVEAAVAAARPTAEAKNINLDVTLDSRPCEVSGDADRLQQVIWNLISNAVKFTPRGGRVETRVERVGSSVEIKVNDTGEGIAPEFLPHVFDRFRQADSSIKRRHGGLGLGLAIVRHLVELHGGEVSVQSPGVGQGATFTVKLPLATIWDAEARARNEERSAPPASRPTISEAAPRLGGVKVLVVDDEADARNLLTEILTGRGAEVRAAGNMAEALSLLNEWRPDALVSDIGMPGGSGYDLIREIRRRDIAGTQLPAVALTAYARTEDRAQALSAGFQTHVSKPVEPQELLAVIASLVG
jgi:PAS domain S-box-containing protein